MAIKDLVRPELPPPTPAAERPPNITCESTRGAGTASAASTSSKAARAPCPTSSSAPSGRSTTGRTSARCPSSRLRPSSSMPAPKPVARDLFGNPLPERRDACGEGRPRLRRSRSLPKPDADAQPAVDVDQLRGFTTEDIESFKALGVEVLLHSETYGDVWLVPAYTGRDRKEITPEHAATLARVMSVFPGLAHRLVREDRQDQQP